MFRLFKQQEKIYDLERENERLKQELAKYDEYFSDIRTIVRKNCWYTRYNQVRSELEEMNAIILEEWSKDSNSYTTEQDIYFKYRLPKRSNQQ